MFWLEIEIESLAICRSVLLGRTLCQKEDFTLVQVCVWAAFGISYPVNTFI